MIFDNPYPIPSGWTERRLGKVVTLQRGFDLPTADRRPGIVPVISSSGQSGSHDTAMVNAPGIVTGRYGTVGEIFWIEKDFWPLNTSLFVKDFHGNYPLFIYYLLQRVNLKRLSDKTGVPGINRNDVHKIKVLVPPIAEQKRIVEILEVWDGAIEIVEQLITAKQKLKKAIYQNRLPIPRKAEHLGWHLCKLRDCLALGLQYGANASSVEFDPCLPRYIRITDIKEDGTLSDHDIKSIELESLHGYLLEENDFLFARSGATVGKTYLHKNQSGNYVFAGYLLRCRTNPEKLLPEFLFHYTQTEQYKYWVTSTLRAGAQPNINAKEYGSLKLPLPSIQEQQEIIKLLNFVDSEIRLFSTHVKLLRKQKQGLMQKLLTGEWRVPVEEEVAA